MLERITLRRALTDIWLIFLIGDNSPRPINYSQVLERTRLKDYHGMG